MFWWCDINDISMGFCKRPCNLSTFTYVAVGFFHFTSVTCTHMCVSVWRKSVKGNKTAVLVSIFSRDFLFVPLIIYFSTRSSVHLFVHHTVHLYTQVPLHSSTSVQIIISIRVPPLNDVTTAHDALPQSKMFAFWMVDRNSLAGSRLMTQQYRCVFRYHRAFGFSSPLSFLL